MTNIPFVWNILSSSKWKKNLILGRIVIIELERNIDLTVSYFMLNTKFHFIWFLRNFIYPLNMKGDYVRRKLSYDQKPKTWTNSIISMMIRVTPSLLSPILYRLHAFCPLIKRLKSQKKKTKTGCKSRLRHLDGLVG